MHIYTNPFMAGSSTMENNINYRMDKIHFELCLQWETEQPLHYNSLRSTLVGKNENSDSYFINHHYGRFLYSSLKWKQTYAITKMENKPTQSYTNYHHGSVVEKERTEGRYIT